MATTKALSASTPAHEFPAMLHACLWGDRFRVAWRSMSLNLRFLHTGLF